MFSPIFTTSNIKRQRFEAFVLEPSSGAGSDWSADDVTDFVIYSAPSTLRVSVSCTTTRALVCKLQL